MHTHMLCNQKFTLSFSPIIVCTFSCEYWLCVCVSVRVGVVGGAYHCHFSKEHSSDSCCHWCKQNHFSFPGGWKGGRERGREKKCGVKEESESSACWAMLPTSGHIPAVWLQVTHMLVVTKKLLGSYNTWTVRLQYNRYSSSRNKYCYVLCVMAQFAIWLISKLATFFIIGQLASKSVNGYDPIYNLSRF